MLQDILDEVLDGDPRYTIKRNNGEVFQDNMDIILKTPVVQEGTPINRELFRNLQGDLYSQYKYNLVGIGESDGHKTAILHSPLTSYERNKIVNVEFNKFTGTTSDDNGIPFREITPYETTASGNSTTSIRAFDLDSSSFWSSDGTEYENIWVQIEFEERITLKKIATMVQASDGSEYFTSAYLQGSRAGSTWTNLATLSHQTTLTTFDLSNTSAYKYYRIVGNVANGHALRVYDFRILEYSGAKTSFKDGELYLNVNELGEKRINGEISTEKKYTLVYNGESWDIQKNIFVSGSYSENSNSSGYRYVDIGINYKYIIITMPTEVASENSNNLLVLIRDVAPMGYTYNRPNVTQHSSITIEENRLRLYANSPNRFSFSYIAFE